MALPDISWTNNLGTISFRRALLSVADAWQWAGRGVVTTKQIQVDGHVKQDFITPEGNEAVLNGPVLDKMRGTRGTLVLPWASIPNVKLTGLDYPVGVWLDYQPVSATFADDHPAGAAYTLTYFGLPLLNPRIGQPIPARPLRDEYLQMPRQPIGQVFLPSSAAGVMRTKGGHKLMAISITGAISVPNGVLPTNLIETLIHRASMTPDSLDPNVPAGYPAPFNLGDAIPELASDLNFANCIVAESRFSWKVEQNVVQVSLSLLSQPQLVEV
jgi:hypothetical protein